jgi:transcriptional regulator with XRE-family HTH domain
MTFNPNRIKSYLRSKGISQKELAEKMEVTPQWISMILTGKFKYLKPEFMVDMAKNIGVTAEELSKLLKGEDIK